MAVKETTTFQCGNNASVSVCGSELIVQVGFLIPPLQKFKLSRGEARDLAKALSHAADIVRTTKKPKAGQADG